MSDAFFEADATRSRLSFYYIFLITMTIIIVVIIIIIIVIIIPLYGAYYHTIILSLYYCSYPCTQYVQHETGPRFFPGGNALGVTPHGCRELFFGVLQDSQRW